MTGLQLARWGAAAGAGGISRSSAAKLAGVSKRHLQRLLAAHADDPAVQRDQLLADAVGWEQQGARTLAEACSRATAWMREATSNPDSDPRAVAAAFSAAIQAGHRLAESGARRARRLQPEQPQQQARFDVEAFLDAAAAACAQIRQQLPPEQHSQAFETLHQQLRSDQQAEALGPPIDVEAQQVGPQVEQEPEATPCPF